MNIGEKMRTCLTLDTAVVGIFAATLISHIVASCSGIQAPLVDCHLFRQTQTALAAEHLQREGISLQTYIPVFGPPWDVPFECPIYQNIVAIIARLSGFGVIECARGVSLASFYAMLPAAFALIRYFTNTKRGAYIFLSLVLLSPTFRFWPSSVMIEMTALAFSVWGMWTLVFAMGEPSLAKLAVPSVLFSLAGLTKITTLLVWLTVAGAWWIREIVTQLRAGKSLMAVLRQCVLVCIPVAVAIGVSIVWVRYSDRVKGMNVLTAGLTSQALKDWNFGTWKQLVAAATWERWHLYFSYTFGSDLNFLIVGVLFLLLRQYRGLAAAAALFLIPLTIFTNLYFTHDYYFCANALLLIAAVSLPLLALIEARELGVLGKALVFSIVALQLSDAFYFYKTRPHAPSANVAAVADKLRSCTRVDDVVLVYGASWDPTLAFYSERRLLMDYGQRAIATGPLGKIISSMPHGSVRAVVILGDLRKNRGFVAEQLTALGIALIPVWENEQSAIYINDGGGDPHVSK